MTYTKVDGHLLTVKAFGLHSVLNEFLQCFHCFDTVGGVIGRHLDLTNDTQSSSLRELLGSQPNLK